MKYQKSFVKDELIKHGKISRNYCLQNYVSRLGALINTLKKEGWEFTTKYIDTEYGKDYVYIVNKSSIGYLEELRSYN